MGKLIDAEALMERMREQAGCRDCNSYDGVLCRACAWEDAMNLADEAPAIDAVPVVRCEDCKYADKGERGGSIFHYFCDHTEDYVTDGWFCPNGERRDSDE